MVATRRTAPTGTDAEMPDPELALKKKPVRKATAKTAAKAEPAPKAKTTRSKKAELAAAAETSEPAEPAPKPRGRGRPKKTTEVEAQPEPQPEPEESAKPTKTTRATKTASTRARKPAVALDETPDLTAPKEAKPARQTRAAASKAPPLSPKKITQVAKPQTRNAKHVDQKPSAKTAAAKGSVRGRAATRSRKVSDENAEVPNLAQPAEEDGSTVVVSSTPVKKLATRRGAAKKQDSDDTEMSMSTSATTPTASPALSHREDAASEGNGHSADPSTPGKNDQSIDGEDESDDELCGPKTPMRHGSPGAEARYHSSAQRTIRRYNEEQRMQTPARRYVVLGSQRGTPQTQKPYCKPTAPSSEVRPMTVARAANRAFVFRDLREGAPELPRRQMEQDSIAEEEDLSFIPDDNIIALDDEGENAQLTTPTGPAPVQLASPPTSSTDIEDAEMQSELDPNESEPEDSSIADVDAAEDPDATIITEEHHDMDVDVPAEQDKPDSFETEDTVIISRPEHISPSDETMSSIVPESEASVIHTEAIDSRPETMMWDNVRPESEIIVDFDNHLNESRTLPEPEPTEVLDIASKLDQHLERSQTNASAETESEHEDEQVEETQQAYLSDQQEQTPLETPNVDINDYFDMGALAEPTHAFDLAPEPQDAVDIEMSDAHAPQTIPEPENEITEKLAASVRTGSAAEGPAPEELAPKPTHVHMPVAPQCETCDQTAPGNAVFEGDEDQDWAIAEAEHEVEVPHYARSTFAFDARRQSLPATSMFTPIRLDTRPSTSDAASISRMANPFGQSWWARSRANSAVGTPCGTPHRARPSTAHGAANSAISTPAKPSTPATRARYPVFRARPTDIDRSQTVVTARFRDAAEKPATRRQTFHRAISGRTNQPSTPVAAATAAKVATPVQTPRERYPALGSRSTYVDHSQTAAPPTRFQCREEKPSDRRKTFHRAVSGKTQTAGTPVKPATPAKVETPVATPKERYPALGSRTNYVDYAKTAVPPARFQNHQDKPTSRRQTFHRAMSGKAADKDDGATPVAETPVKDATSIELQQTPAQQTSEERFPRLGARENYQDHAQTVAAPRFKTPAKSPVKRAATIQKPASMRKAALRNSAATPMKTPLKAPAMTPAQEPMTPHPAAPLRGVVALVEVYTLEGASASSPFIALLHRLGAKTTRTWTDRVTHVIFKDGSPTTLQRVRLHNKEVATAGRVTHIFCVNSRWVSDCDAAGSREDENDEAYAVDVEEVPRGGKRRRKSMEPSALANVGGNIVRDRKSSLGRSSLGRSSIRFSESPAKKAKLEVEGDVAPGAEVEDKENSEDEPATPAWIAQPNKLVQMTAPMKRVRKLDLEEKSSRRMTFWESGS